MKRHDHYAGCRWNGKPNREAWLGHARSVLVSWLVITVVLYLVIVIVAVCVKAIR